MFDSKRMSKYIRMKIKIKFTKHCTGDPGDFMETVEIRGKFGTLMTSTLASIVLKFSCNLYCFNKFPRVARALLRAIRTIQAITCLLVKMIQSEFSYELKRYFRSKYK